MLWADFLYCTVSILKGLWSSLFFFLFFKFPFLLQLVPFTGQGFIKQVLKERMPFMILLSQVIYLLASARGNWALWSGPSAEV